MSTFADFGIRIPFGAHGDVKTVCPRCSHDRRKPNDPCLSVNADSGVWNCHHCAWSGSLRASIDERRHRFRPLSIKPKPQTETIFEAMWRRGITRAVVERNRLWLERRTMSDKKQHNCAAFPYYADGELVNVKYRGGDKQFAQEKNADRSLYKVDDLIGQTEAIITEGEVDALSFEVAGFANAVSMPDGAINENVKSAAGKLKALDTCWHFFEAVERIYLATDNDGPGLRLREELARRLDKRRCLIVTFPDGCKDANDVLMKHGAEALRRCVEEAQPYPLEGIRTVSDIRPEMEALYEMGYPLGAKTGIIELDRLMEFNAGQLTVTTGIPGHMKSGFTDYRNIQLMRNADWSFAYFTPEHYPTETHLHRLVEQLVGKPLLPNAQGRMSHGEMAEALDYLCTRVYYIQPENDEFTLEQILNSGSDLVKRYGVNGIVLDPWNHVEHQMGRDSETIYIGKALRRAKQFAREYGIHFDVIAHTTKLVPGADGVFAPPTMYHISGSANWFNVPDNGVVVYREIDPESYEDKGIVYYQRKVKYQHQGRVGRSYFKLEPRSHSFRPIDARDYDANPPQRMEGKRSDVRPPKKVNGKHHANGHQLTTGTADEYQFGDGGDPF